MIDVLALLAARALLAVRALLAAAAVLTLVGCGGAPSAAPEEAGRSSRPAASSATGEPSQGAGRPTTPAASTSAGAAERDVLPAVQAYVDAVNRRDLDGLTNAFRPAGRIVDVSRTIAGRDAIRNWASNEVIGGSLSVVRIVERRPDGQKLLVRWAPAGSDGWLAHYDFTVAGNEIELANLQYA